MHAFCVHLIPQAAGSLLLDVLLVSKALTGSSSGVYRWKPVSLYMSGSSAIVILS